MFKDIERVDKKVDHLGAKLLKRVKLLEGAEAPDVDPVNITEGTLNAAAADRTVDMAAFDLDIKGTGDKSIKRGPDTLSIGDNYGEVKVLTAGTTVTYNKQNHYYNQLNIIDTGLYINANSAASVNLLTTGAVEIKSVTGNYKIGDSSTSIPQGFSSEASVPRALSVMDDGSVKHTYTGSYFIDSSLITTAITGHPTTAEVVTYLGTLTTAIKAGLKNRILYYTGTVTSTDTYTYSWCVDGLGKLYLLDKPAISKSFMQKRIASDQNVNNNGVLFFGGAAISNGTKIVATSNVNTTLAQGSKYKITLSLVLKDNGTSEDVNILLVYNSVTVHVLTTKVTYGEKISLSYSFIVDAPNVTNTLSFSTTLGSGNAGNTVIYTSDSTTLIVEEL